MKIRTFTVVGILAVLFALTGTALAGTTVVGVEIGKDTRVTIEEKVKAKGSAVTEGKALPFLTGSTMVVKGDTYDISGLTEVHFGFDQNATLGFVGMIMDPAKFDAMDQILRSKYEFLENHGQPGGARCAHYASDDTIIDLILDIGAPLQLLYVRKDLQPKPDTTPAPAKNEADNF